MGFLFGLMLGSGVSGGTISLPPSVGTIPFRCLAAFERNETEYELCRRGSLRWEIAKSSSCNWEDLDKPNHHCWYMSHITWELQGLRELKRAILARSLPEGK
jgi:hypothetical protein